MSSLSYEECIIQKWNLQERNKGIIHLRTKNGQRKRVTIAFRDEDSDLVNGMFKRYKNFRLRAFMDDNNKCIRFTHFFCKTYQNKDSDINSLLFQMAMEQVEELKAKNEKIEDKCQQQASEKQKAQGQIKEYMEKRETARSIEMIAKAQIQRLKENVRRLRVIIAQLSNLLVDQSNTRNIRNQQTYLHDINNGGDKTRH